MLFLKSSTIGLLLFSCSTLCLSQTVSTFVSNSVAIDEALFRTENGQLYGTGYVNGTFNSFDEGFVLPLLDSLENPSEITELSTGEIAIVESQGDRIMLYDPVNDTAEILTSDIQNPAGILKMPDSDTLLVSSLLNNSIYSVSPDGDTNAYLSNSLFDAPVSLVWDDSNNLYIANYNSGIIVKKSADNTVTQLCSLPTTSLGHIIRIGNTLFATAVFDNKIYKIDLTTGSWAIFAGSSQGSDDGDINVAKFNTPNGITASISGDSLFVSEYNTKSIRLISGVLNHIGIPELPENSSKNLIALWPNPIQDELYILFKKPDTFFRIELVGSHGITTPLYTKALSQQNNTVKIDIPNSLSSGFYFLKMSSENGIETRKIIIQK
jgi:hypothetical protein